MTFSSINLLWQKRFRGLAPVSAHSAADSGTALVIRPDEFERRTYQLLQLQPDGAAREVGAISVETVFKFEVLSDGRLILGMTDDDIYIFRDGKKVRFMADRRVTYTDVALSPEQGWFVASFSDSVFSTHGAAFGDQGARLGWVRDLNVPVNRVALTHDGQTVALGLADGRVLAVDHMRRALWEFPTEAAISALALPRHGARPVAGTDGGTVVALDEEGGIRWRSPVGLPVTGLATDAEGTWVAAALSDGATHSLVCFGPDGDFLWDYALEARPTGISLAPGGRFLLLSLANGTALHFEVDFAAGALAGRVPKREQLLAGAREAVAESDPERAYTLLKELADAEPHDLEVAEVWLGARSALLNQMVAQARAQMEAGEWNVALELLDRAAEIDSRSEAVFSARRKAREAVVREGASLAAQAEADGDPEWAEAEWHRVLERDPGCMDARRQLARLRGVRARALLAQGDERLEQGDRDAAIALWTEAQRLTGDAEVSGRLRRAEVDRSVTAGVALYEAGRLPEAIFQLKKALALDPDHEEARRHLSYAEGQTGDPAIADRFARLE